MKYVYKGIFVTLVFAFSFSFAYAQQIPTGVQIGLDDLLEISENIGGFLMVLGGVLGGIAVILAGIMYLGSGSNPARVKGAKDMLKAAVVGSLILFSVGVIINFIRGFATNPFQFFM